MIAHTFLKLLALMIVLAVIRNTNEKFTEMLKKDGHAPGTRVLGVAALDLIIVASLWYLGLRV